jgi:Carboxypeptidase regulatory-like domain
MDAPAFRTKIQIFLGVLATALAVSRGGAQTPRQQPVAGRGLIVGQVIDAVTGKPLRDAIVSITAASQVARNDSPSPPSILTAADGYFVFRDLARGTFVIRATKQGYIDGLAGRRRPGGPSQPVSLTDGQRVGSVAVLMWRPGAFTGTVVDEADEPLVNVRVRAFRRTIGSGRPRFLGAATATTDDRGAYRLGGLLPGEYIVLVPARQVIMPQATAREVRAGRAVPPREFANELSANAKAIQAGGSLITLAGSPTPPFGGADRIFIYPPTFHPSALTIGLTVPLTIGAGEERGGIDLQLHPVPTLRVSGFLMGPDGAVPGVPVQLWPAAFEDFALEQDATTAITDATGAFSFPAVPDGQYSLRASTGQVAAAGVARPLQAPRWAEVPVTVGRGDVDGVVMTLKDALQIRGRIELDGARQRAAPVRLDQLPMLAQSADGSPILGVAPPSAPTTNGDFTIVGLSPGRYFVGPAGAPAGWVLKSAMFDGRDLSDMPLALQADVNGVVVTFTDRSTELRGIVRLPEGQPDPKAIVIAFPADIAAWSDFGPSPRRVRSSWTTKAGEYSIAALPPGQYYLLAVPDEAAADWREASSLEAMSRVAMLLSIRHGEQKTQDLRTRSRW